MVAPLFIDVSVNDELDPAITALLETEAQPTATTTKTVSATNSPITEVASAPLPTTPTEAATPQPIVRGPFAISDTPGHPASGIVRVIETPADGTTVRFENYDGTNGPDLFVYLATDLNATEFINLGRAKGNQGNINYTVPENIDIDDYQYVLTWCKAFGVLFDYAEIN